MTIPRTAWIDDDGSGTTGTIINNAEKTILYDQIDAATVGPPFRLGGSFLAYNMTLGIYNNFQPPAGSSNVVWALANTNTLVTGLIAEADLTQHLIINIGPGQIQLFNQHGDSAVANRLICPGYTTYVMNAWASLWVMYTTYYNSWIVQKP